ncbi:MAG: hypothetical protein ACI4WS_12305 [Oscillospiraceae bacterium]
MHKQILPALAVFCQFLALFPFIVLTEGIGFGGYTLWHYAVFYAAVAVFYLCGRLLGICAANRGLSRRARPWVMFLSRIGFIAPAVVFCVVCAVLELHSGLYIYLLPGCVAGYFGGYLSTGREYSDIFTRGWFAAYFVAAILAAGLLSFTRDKALSSAGMTQLCVGFGVIIVLAAVLTNQTNIDMQTRQRAGGRAVLPKGTRSYNALLIAGAGALVVGLFLLTGPVTRILMDGIKALLRWLLSLLRQDEAEDLVDGEMQENTNSEMQYYENDNPFADLLMLVFWAVILFLAVKFRRQIWNFFKEIFQPLFKVPQDEEQAPFVDELSASGVTMQSEREQRRSERELYRRYRRETDPVLKYRQGYELFLANLKRTPFSQLATDTTTVHSDKGDKAFSTRVSEQELDGMIKVYDRVRYGGEVPQPQELEALDRIIEAINGKTGDKQ